MFQRTLSVILFVLLSSFVAAQSPTPPTPVQGPPLMDSCKWEIRDGNDEPIGYHAEYEIVGFDPWTGAVEYRFRVFNTRTGEDTGGYGYAYDPGFGGYVLDVWSSDSGLNYEMHWDGDHYDKVGGSSAVRSYHPM